MSNSQFSNINNTNLQRVGGNVDKAAFISGLRVLKGSIAPEDTSKVAIVGKDGNQLLLGTTDAVLWVGVRNNNPEDPTVTVCRGGAPLMTTLAFVTNIKNTTARSSNTTIARNDVYLTANASAGISSGNIEITLIVSSVNYVPLLLA